MIDQSSIFSVGGVVAALTVCAAVTWYAWIIRLERRRLRIARGQCVQCGYDLRASRGNCPECNTPIQLRAKDLVERGECIVKIDVPCSGCGGNLRGKYRIGPRGVCWTEVQDSIRQDVAATLGVALDQVKFIETALYERWHGRRKWRKRAPDPIDACGACIAVRDFALSLNWRRSKAKKMLIDLGITDSDQIGKVIWGLVDRGTYQAQPGDRPEHFQNLFTLDELMSAKGLRERSYLIEQKSKRNSGLD